MTREITLDAAGLPLRYELVVGGVNCAVQTNSHLVGDATECWRSVAPQSDPVEFCMRVQVMRSQRTHKEPPHFRGLHHLVIASFGAANVFVFDLARGEVAACIEEALAADPLFWDRLLLPIALGVLGATVGILPVHSACLGVRAEGLLIAGISGAGKSTLAVALAQHGFDFVSDDWTYLSLARGQLVATGMRQPAKLLPDALQYFDFLAHYNTSLALNQELAYLVPPDAFAKGVRLACHPRWFVFLERTDSRECAITRIPAAEASRYIEGSVEALPYQLSNAIKARAQLIHRTAHLECWKLRYGGPPDVAVRCLQAFVAQEQDGAA